MKKSLIIIIIIITIIILVGGLLIYKRNDDQNTNHNNDIQNLTYENNVQDESYNTADENIQDNSNNVEQYANSTKDRENNQNNTNNDESANNNSDVTIKEKLAPSGFMGSSLVKVTLYSNGDVYILYYDGTGYEEKNISDKKLIATKADSIYYRGTGEDFEAIVVKGGPDMEIKNKDFGWIDFEQ